MNKIPVRKISTGNIESSTAGRFSIRTVKQITNGKELVHPLHRHDFYFILVLKKGKGKHTIDFTSFDAANNSVFILRPGQVHELQLKVNAEGFLIEFNNEFYHPVEKLSLQRMRKLTTNNFYQLEKKGLEKLYAVLTCMHNECKEMEEGYLEIIKSNLGTFFIELGRQTAAITNTSTAGKAYEQERLDEFLELLDQHIANHKQVAWYTNLMSLSSYQLNEITKSSIGKTASELINEHILLEAKRYLLATANQVKEIADRLGYEDVSYFIRFFRKHIGSTPDAFRQNFR